MFCITSTLVVTIVFCYWLGGGLALVFAMLSSMGFLALVGVFEVTNGIIKGAYRISKMANI